MPKQLVLMRHAKSDWSGVSNNDFERELNSRGYRDAPKMGVRIKLEKKFNADLAISSSAARAKLTARYVCEQLNYSEDSIHYDEDIYEGSLRTLLRIVNDIDNKHNRVIIFGHNPGFTYFAEFLTKLAIGNIPTSGVISITFEVNSWQLISEGLGHLDWFIYPKDSIE